ncbi:hypothetical protein F4679DRAFT_535675 [Xylaria curta]|nr:hypothetical protein F4679DRAFT_535675 [Xylaria curta]
MAQHPHGYGQHFGHYAPPPLSASSAQPSYYYPQPQAAAPLLPANYATSQSAYSHNATRIPGLGLGGGPMAATPQFPPAPTQQWPAQGQPQTNTFLQSHQQPPPSLPQKPSVPQQQPHNALEEGELSEEGEFEDLYEPKAPTDPSQPPLHNKPHHTLISLDSRGGSVGDADGSSIYDPHDPHVTHDDSATQARSNTAPGAEQECPDDEWEPSYPDRERSGSYSPYLSPREVHRKHSVGKITLKATDRVEPSKSTQQTSMPLPKTSSAMPQPNETNFALDVNNNVGPTSASKHESHINGLSPIRSPLEAKKKAQEAILGLWPLKVRYQDYIDEGVDTNVVKTLFKDLGLDVPNPKTVTVSTKTTNDVQSTPVQAVSPSNTSPTPQSPSILKTQAPLPNVNQPNKKDDKGKSGGTKVAEKSAAEERKDKIARKLAAMAQKTTTAQPPGQDASASTPVSAPAPAPATVAVSVPSPSPAPNPAPAPVETTPSTAKLDSATTQSAVTKTRAENNAILQQKLAALKKQQAQLAAEKARVISNESTTASSPAVEPSHSDTNRNGNSTPNNRSVAPAQQNSNQQNELPGTSKDEGIPGLSFPSLSLPQSAQGPSRSLKRPVASDFDNFTPRFESLKRTRTNERLVIDVSDDEDVEMDIGSPAEEFPPSADSNGAPRQALGTFPPLSDGLNRRQRDSPASSSAPTPPVHGARIDLLQKRIEEAKRLIAEAEAKKAAKRATTQSSPKLSSQTTQPPVNLPKVDESNLEAKRIVNSRRDRIASYELPRVSAALKEKQDKLKLLVAEAARLELEVQASLDEQRKLKTEMDCLVEPSTAVSPEPVEQPQRRDGKYPGLGTQLPAQAPNVFTDSSQPEQVEASENHQSLSEKRGEEESLRDQESPSANVNGGMDPKLNNDEALQAAILTDNTHDMDTQMTDADGPSRGTDNTPLINETIAADISPSSLDTSGPAETSAAGLEEDMQQTAEEFSTDADVEVGSIAKSDTSPSEPDVESSESDVSMQQSIAELSQSDDESYEPTPAEISDSHSVQKDEPDNTEVIDYSHFLGDYPLTKLQVIDDILEEPSPNHMLTDRNHQEPESTSKEVKNRSCKEPLLLTGSQDALRNTPPLEDLLSYKSPLSYFRAYRFHPKYSEEVPGGLKSMTFSARIDPMREVCPHALAGETCPKGTGCEYQHFDSMTLQDAEIITQLGSADMFIGEARTKFIEGLKRVLNELKANRIKDFDRITQAIVKHRQDFLGDKTKVLALDSVAT